MTDAALNMVACVKNLRLRHTICIAHMLNLVVKKAMDQTPGLTDVHTRARKMVGYFRSSATAKAFIGNDSALSV